ncbi:hypothetical protein ASPWEDRAFT_46646 [Aspergillus wentii DTO 134E9]|uniref:Enoyl reductase (ER) domain-containing protein n=1 Tax=Aspergillus wentii DTO 134E9 TaxID=1073089 RepID=A0A1L9R4N7_ASPWE|nr:uncharacterized protein ASPWEDRAFT_46646 [Aspergillus wentii DTO 134E9]OJJ29895.1 hypothetical protein ASPWEDRAFT_46646 [Aspergillus wentii DTO 134E9]
MTATTNTAAWLMAAAHPFAVKSAPTWKPEENEILTRNHAVAINPIDGSLQTKAWMPMGYPTILGEDVAGEVIAVGPNVTRFKPGDRVLGHALGFLTGRDQDGAFQAHTTLRVNMASKIPDRISYEKAVVIPLTFSTASAGLFQEEYLKLNLPTEPRAQPTGKTILIWGGASSVGSNAIQLAVAAGCDVITTASQKNFDYVKNLGASQVFDYRSPTTTEALIQAMQDKTIAGAMDCIGSSATQACIDVMKQCDGNRFVVTVNSGFQTVQDIVTVKGVMGASIKDNFVSKAVYEDFLPRALEEGTFKPSPEPVIVGNGLEIVQEALDLHGKGGISARKLVVLLE